MPGSCSSRMGGPPARSWWTRSRPATSRSGGGSGASTRPPAATARPVGWRPAWTSRCSSTTARTSTAASPAVTSSRGPTSSSPIGCSRAPSRRRPGSAGLRPVHGGGRRRAGARPRGPGDVRRRGVDRAPRSRLHVRVGPRGALAGGERPAPPGCLRAATSSSTSRRRFAAEPSVVWAHLTTPALRSRWEGPLVIEESSVGGRRGVGTITQCVTGRLATHRGGRRLAAVRPHRLARHGPRCRAGRGNGRPGSGRGRDAGPPALEHRRAGARRGRRTSTAIAREKRAALERLARMLDAGSGMTEAQEART